MNRFPFPGALAALALLIAGHAFARSGPDSSLVAMDSRFSGFDAIAHIQKNHSDWSAVADISLDERSGGQAVEHSVELVKLIGVPAHVCEAASLPLESESGSASSE